MIRKIIGKLMFLANNEGCKEPWYSLKDKLGRKYGMNDGYDIQFIEGKKCYSCGGTGLYRKYSFGSAYNEECWNCCGNGWYKDNIYVLLERIKVGNYTFHKPIRRSLNKKVLEEMSIPQSVTINGYVNHSIKKYGWLAFTILFLIFDFKAYRNYVSKWGLDWRCSWWLPKNYLHNIMHFKRHGLNSIPLRRLNSLKISKKSKLSVIVDDELPF